MKTKFVHTCDERLSLNIFVYYESIKRETNIKPIYEFWCDERLKTKDEESTLLGYTGFLGELEHLKIKSRLIDEKFASVMCLGNYRLTVYIYGST